MNALGVAVVPAPAPIGALTLGVTDGGLAFVGWGEDMALAGRAAARLGLDVVADGRADDAATELTEYLAGTRRVFGTPVDWSLTHVGAQRRVLQALHASVAYGAVVTYGELAVRGRLDSPRGVGTIMGSNPIPVVVPCHRVLAAAGLGGFGGGTSTKEWLLALEGVLTPAFDFGADQS